MGYLPNGEEWGTCINQKLPINTWSKTNTDTERYNGKKAPSVLHPLHKTSCNVISVHTSYNKVSSSSCLLQTLKEIQGQAFGSVIAGNWELLERLVRSAGRIGIERMSQEGIGARSTRERPGRGEPRTPLTSTGPQSVQSGGGGGGGRARLTYVHLGNETRISGLFDCVSRMDVIVVSKYLTLSMMSSADMSLSYCLPLSTWWDVYTVFFKIRLEKSRLKICFVSFDASSGATLVQRKLAIGTVCPRDSLCAHAGKRLERKHQQRNGENARKEVEKERAHVPAVGGLVGPTLSLVKLASALTAGMNPHHPGHSAAYPHHPSLSSSPHHSGPHHGYSTGSGGGGGGGGGTTTTPDLPSPHSPPHGPAIDPATPYGSLQPGQGMGSNGHHHGGAGMMTDHPHHPGHPHPHLPGHPAYPPVNHNNNCTLKQEGGPSGPTGIQQCAGCGGQIVERWLLLAMDRYWHNGCLKCSYCGAALAEIGHSCYTRSGMILCKSDYRSVVRGSDDAGSSSKEHADTYTFVAGCCQPAGVLVPWRGDDGGSDGRSLKKLEGGGGGGSNDKGKKMTLMMEDLSCIIRERLVLLLREFDTSPEQAVANGREFCTIRHVKRVSWHRKDANPTQSSVHGKSLITGTASFAPLLSRKLIEYMSTLEVREKETVQLDCCLSYIRQMFGSSGACAGCGNAIPATELVMRAGGSVFHQKCFTCSKCGNQLVSGDRYYLLSGSPVCETDWHKIVKSSTVAAAAAAAAAGNGGAPVRKGGNPVGRPKKVQASPQPTPVVVPSQVDVVDVAVGGDPYSPPPPGHQQYHHHHHHHHHHHQMGLVHPGLAVQQTHLQASTYQEWSPWAQDTCD
ncbi:LIM domain transcription factor LMO4-B [Melipona quadrifasciata]|uniref:LIM domain transcription factor LMO4-B n=1 Tax=Melipona quadrifasciata TaxID=166423 RepID=A0A0M9A1C4_9HYME|nr:LIM domain transcription factor LMO4-B [Melipona quadrifasciata]